MAVQGAGFGISNDEATGAAVSSAVSTAMEALGGKQPSIAFVSATVARDVEEVRAAFAEKLPDNIPIHGITSSAALLTTNGAVAKSVGCLLLSSAGDDDFATAFDSSDGKKAAQDLKSKMASPQAIFMGATPGAEEGVISALGEVFPGVPVYGGTAADDELNGSWSVFSADASSGTGVSLVGIGPAVGFGASMLGPYTASTQTAVATKSDGRRVFEIDGKSAADWVFEWLGDSVKNEYENGGLILPQTAQSPIAIQVGDSYVTAHCAAFGKDDDGTPFVDFFAPIPQGSQLTIMDSGSGPSTGYASALNQAYDEAAATVEPKAGILVYCGGMAIAVGDKLDAGLTEDGFSSKVGATPMLGMTCFGEQACLQKSSTNVQRNLSVGMLVFG